MFCEAEYWLGDQNSSGCLGCGCSVDGWVVVDGVCRIDDLGSLDCVDSSCRLIGMFRWLGVVGWSRKLIG